MCRCTYCAIDWLSFFCPCNKFPLHYVWNTRAKRVGACVTVTARGHSIRYWVVNFPTSHSLTRPQRDSTTLIYRPHVTNRMNCSLQPLQEPHHRTFCTDSTWSILTSLTSPDGGDFLVGECTENVRVCGAEFSMIGRQRVLDPCWTALQAITEGIPVVNSTITQSFACVNCFPPILEKKKR